MATGKRRQVWWGLVALGWLGGCAEAPPPQCAQPRQTATAEERLADSACFLREVTRRIFVPGGCEADAHTVGLGAVEHCWGADVPAGCVRDDWQQEHWNSAVQSVTDQALAGQRQLRTFGQCMAPRP